MSNQSSAFNNDVSVGEVSVSPQLWVGRPLDYSRYGEVRRPPSGTQLVDRHNGDLDRQLSSVILNDYVNFQPMNGEEELWTPG